MCKVTIGNLSLKAEKGEKLSELFQRCGIDSPHPCAGRGSCKKCRVLVDGKEELSCSYVIESDIEVILQKDGHIDLESFADIEENEKNDLFYALDLGTTTLSLALVTPSGKKIRQANSANPQSVFGGDVISRIDYCQRNGVEALQGILIKRINEMTDAIGHSAKYMYVAGNATMLHLFLGVDCTSIGVAPYTAVFLEKKELDAPELSLRNVERVITLPSAHSFVGADVIAGLGYLKMPEEGRYSILLDLGTNAELVLFSRDKILCTAAAAGPCFEGANISCGKSAIGGAISSFCFKDGRPHYTTISSGEPDGICATGLIDTVAALLEEDIIDESGYMDEDFAFTDKISLTTGDVRELQLAKSAVCSAIEALISDMGIDLDDIEMLYVSGGFSQKLSVESAVTVGLLPSRLKEKYLSIGNSSLEGIIRYVVDKTPLEALAERSEYVDLAKSSIFMTRFIENMSF